MWKAKPLVRHMIFLYLSYSITVDNSFSLFFSLPTHLFRSTSTTIFQYRRKTKIFSVNILITPWDQLSKNRGFNITIIIIIVVITFYNTRSVRRHIVLWTRYVYINTYPIAAYCSSENERKTYVVKNYSYSFCLVFQFIIEDNDYVISSNNIFSL